MLGLGLQKILLSQRRRGAEGPLAQRPASTCTQANKAALPFLLSSPEQPSVGLLPPGTADAHE